MSEKSNKQAFIYAGAGIFFWSTVATAFKLALKEVSYIQLLTYTSLVSLVTLFIIMLIKKRPLLINFTNKKNLINSVLSGLLNPFLYYLILFKAYDLLPAQEAMVLNYAWPLVLVVLSGIILRQKIKLLSYLALLISFSGIIVIASKGQVTSMHFDNLPGTLLAVGSSLIWALFWIINMKDKRNEVDKLFSGFVFGFIFSFTLLIVSPESLIINSKSLLPVIYIGLFEMSITFTLWLTALSKAETTDKISNLVFLSPFISLIIISIVLKEEILPSTFVGLLLIITGIVTQKIFSRKKKELKA